jgi:putative membrane protein
MVNKSFKFIIVIFSIVIPIAVALLYFLPSLKIIDKSIAYQLPLLNAFINGSTALVLIAAFLTIKKGRIEVHKKLMLSALTLSILFLVSYVIYHASVPSTKYGNEGTIKYVYYIILFTHIVLAAVIIPFVLISFSRALNNNFLQHKKIAKITLPLWLYVSITGVIIYIMISPYYV